MGDYKDPDDPETEEPEWVKEETQKFKEEYDKDKDGKLNKEEVSQCCLYLFSLSLLSKSQQQQQQQQVVVLGPVVWKAD